MKHWLKKIMRYFLLLLFLGYYGSLTLFTHTHIVYGVTIVHSHPFKSGTEKNPFSHQHTAKGIINIQLLSNFLITLTFLVFSSEAFKAVLRKYIFKKDDDNFSDLSFLYSNGLRAPPYKYTF